MGKKTRSKSKSERVVPCRASGDGNYFDRLPDDIVIGIVDRLELKDAAKTYVLSKRFHSMWESAIMHKKNFDFKDVDWKQRWNFKNFANRVLSRHQGSTLHSLRIAISKEYGSFENWLEFARTKCVANLRIELSSRSYYGTGVRLHLPKLQGWDNLTSLSLRYVEVKYADLEHCLKSGFINLESLIIESADLERLVVNSPKLKRLEIKSCIGRLRSIAIDFAPNLQRFFIVSFHGCPNVRFKHVPKLSHVLVRRYGFHQQHLMLELQKTGVEKLEMDIFEIRFNSDIWNRYEQFPLLKNLKELNLVFALNEEISCFLHLVFSIVLGACPKLHKLTLKGYKTCTIDDPIVSSDWYASKKDRLRARSHVHQCLKVVEFVGLSRRKMEVDEGVNFLKEITPNLEKITYR